LIDEHPAAFAYDWRHRFGLSLRQVLDIDPDWWETRHLVSALVCDPSSHTAAALAGWSHPWPIEAWLLADLFDLTLQANTTKRNPKRYPRPNDEQPKTFGRATRSQRDIRAALASRGHTIVDGGRNGD
jgi:hypothetical protein